MGISLNLISTIVDSVALYELDGSVLMLGRQDISATKRSFLEVLRSKGVDGALKEQDLREENGWLTPESFFNALGFSEVKSLDVAEAEDSSIFFDLNSAETPSGLKDKFDLVFDGGTFEHVFHLPNALARCGEMIKPGGFLMHIGPMNNYVDHGFYQFSPTLWFDWFSENGWDVLESVMVKLPSRHSWGRGWEFSRLPPGLLGVVGQLSNAPYMHFFLVRKNSHSTVDRIPWQKFYSDRYVSRASNGVELRDFSTYFVSNGLESAYRLAMLKCQKRLVGFFKRLVRLLK